MGNMAKTKDIDIKKLSMPPKAFFVALKRASQQTDKPKSSPKQSKT